MLYVLIALRLSHYSCVAVNAIVVTVLIGDAINAAVFGGIVLVIVIIDACHVAQRYLHSPSP